MLISLTGNEKKLFLTVVIAEVEKVCKLYRFDVDNDLIKDVSVRMCKHCLYYTRREVKEAIQSYYDMPVEHFFTLAALLTHVRNYLAEMTRKRMELKNKLEQEKKYQDWDNIPPLTPKQESEIAKKRDEFFKHVDKIAAEKSVTKKESKPLTDEQIKYQEAKKEYFRTKI